MRNIQTISQLNDLISTTYIYAVIVAVVIFALALLIANLIPWQGGNDRSYIKRRIALLICVFVGSLGFWLYNQLVVMDTIKKVAFQNQFSSANLTCLAITIGGSLIISLVVMFAFRHTKFGSILGKEKNA